MLAVLVVVAAFVGLAGSVGEGGRDGRMMLMVSQGEKSVRAV